MSNTNGTFFGYVSAERTISAGLREVELELVDARWMLRVLYVDLKGVAPAIGAILAGRPFWPTIVAMSEAERNLFRDWSTRFRLRMIAREDPAPVSLATIVVDSRTRAVGEESNECRWHFLSLAPALPISEGEWREDTPPPGYALHAVLGEQPAQDKPPTMNAIDLMHPLGEERNAVLQALHFPLPDTAFGRSVSLLSPGLTPVAPGTGGHLPFVGVMNVGQASCAGLWNHAGRNTVIFDCGRPASRCAATTPPGPSFPDTCACTEPLMVLSHWDYDHYGAARSPKAIQRCCWIVPQQHLGPVANKVLAVILGNREAGVRSADVLVWTSSPAQSPGHAKSRVVAEHMITPWGAIERCTGPMTSKNNSGIAAFVDVVSSGGGRTVLANLGGVSHLSGHASSGISSSPVSRLIPHTLHGVRPGPAVLFMPPAELVLLPGDAGFQDIPSLHAASSPSLVGLVATHHGADTFWSGPGPSQVPRPIAPSCPVIYSYGLRRPPPLRHCHVNASGVGHPTPQATQEYFLSGWSRRLDTCELATQSPQQSTPVPSGIFRGGVSLGHSAVGWNAGSRIVRDVLPSGPMPAGDPIRRVCPGCHCQWEFQY